MIVIYDHYYDQLIKESEVIMRRTLREQVADRQGKNQVRRMRHWIERAIWNQGDGEEFMFLVSGAGADLSDENPQRGVAGGLESPGTSTSASRSDHTHVINYVGSLPSGVPDGFIAVLSGIAYVRANGAWERFSHYG